jgi:hypothetical protein
MPHIPRISYPDCCLIAKDPLLNIVAELKVLRKTKYGKLLPTVSFSAIIAARLTDFLKDGP